jgi:hypothetical protein
MVSVVACLLLGLVLLVSAALKAIDPPGTQAALAGLGVPRPQVAWGALVVVEALLGVTIAAGLDAAAWAAAGLCLGFAAVLTVAMVSGRTGAPCACLGARGRVGRGALVRAAALAAAFSVLPALPRADVSTDGWLAIGLAVALLCCAGLAVGLLALFREVGMLRLAVAPQGALEVPHEGPEIGGRSALGDFFPADGRLRLAVFASEGCGLCRALAPAVEAVGRHPRVALRTFDEAADADAWALADVPGSPYAVALGADGTVLAKGTFNTGAQLETVLAAAERRRGAVRA